MESATRLLLLTGIAILLVKLTDSRAQGDLESLIGQVFKRPETGAGNSNNDNSNNEKPPDDIQDDRGQGYNPLECECVPYYLCQNDTIITDGFGLIDIRIKDDTCENYLDVCCQKPHTVINPITPKPNIRAGCGHRNADGVGFRITGFNEGEAQFGEFPWMVAILREEAVDNNPEKLNVYQCGGALIHTQVVLTAAHCLASLKDPRVLKIRAGEWDTQTKNEVFPHQDRNVKNIVIHPQYHAGALYNDVGLLFLENPVDLAENVDVVCLPNQNEIFDQKNCFASGWGKDMYGKEGRYQVILKRLELPIVPRDVCLEALRKTRLGPYYNLHESFICAGGEKGKDACKGDGGGPLVCPTANDPSRYKQAGIVAWGIGCGETDTPGVYANVGMFRDWIDEQIAYQGLDPTLYNS